jgi:hypothetical protein
MAVGACRHGGLTDGSPSVRGHDVILSYPAYPAYPVPTQCPPAGAPPPWTQTSPAPLTAHAYPLLGTRIT